MFPARFGKSWSYFMCCRLFPLCATWICRWLHQFVTTTGRIVDSIVSEKQNYSLRFETCQRPRTSRRGACGNASFCFLPSTFVWDALLHRSKLPTLVFQKLCQKRSTLWVEWSWPVRSFTLLKYFWQVFWHTSGSWNLLVFAARVLWRRKGSWCAEDL